MVRWLQGWRTSQLLQSVQLARPAGTLNPDLEIGDLLTSPLELPAGAGQPPGGHARAHLPLIHACFNTSDRLVLKRFNTSGDPVLTQNTTTVF